VNRTSFRAPEKQGKSKSARNSAPFLRQGKRDDNVKQERCRAEARRYTKSEAELAAGDILRGVRGWPMILRDECRGMDTEGDGGSGGAAACGGACVF
jgi:hypothetical protein